MVASIEHIDDFVVESVLVFLILFFLRKNSYHEQSSQWLSDIYPKKN